MYLIQILLPLTDNEGKALDGALYAMVSGTLTEKFGGLTAYVRNPAKGMWKEDDNSRPVRDDIVVYEVMTEEIDREWWNTYRERLRVAFKQDDLIVRSLSCDLL